MRSEHVMRLPAKVTGIILNKKFVASTVRLLTGTVLETLNAEDVYLFIFRDAAWAASS